MPQANSNNPDFGPKRLIVELTNICNLHCSYCLRDEEALYHSRANFLAPEFLDSIVKQAMATIGISHVTFTGGEPTLHPGFTNILEIVAANNLTTSFVTNGWNFEKLWPTLLTNKSIITHVAFSVDGATREDHDNWRGEGSFERIVRAFSRCFASELPFVVKTTIRRDNVAKLEQMALFAARMGAAALNFVHVMPTSADIENTSGLNLDERRLAEREIASLARIFRMKIGIDVGYYNLDPRPPCGALAGVNCNVDYRGRMSLCCNLSGYRDGVGEEDIAADLHKYDFATAYALLSEIARDKLAARNQRLQELATQQMSPDLYTASPCLFCLDTSGKLPWRKAIDNRATRKLPVLSAF